MSVLAERPRRRYFNWTPYVTSVKISWTQTKKILKKLFIDEKNVYGPTEHYCLYRISGIFRTCLRLNELMNGCIIFVCKTVLNKFSYE